MPWGATVLSPAAAFFFSMDTGGHLIYFLSGLLRSSNDILDMTHFEQDDILSNDYIL